jgi:hypothetical protein
MPHSMFDVPILIVVFNRPEVTRRLLTVINSLSPAKLFIAADGPRLGNENDIILCEKTRETVKEFTRDLHIKKLFRDKNAGCGPSVSSAISWFFKNVEAGIILEDDCIPEKSFFYFCRELLEKYKNDERIMAINGMNINGTWHPEQSDYFFSYFGYEWGWATWRRAWQHFDYEMRLFNDIKKMKALQNIFTIKKEYRRKIKNYQVAIEGEKVSSWDYQWDFAVMINSGLTIIPSKNLIQNIGSGKYATHTKMPFEKLKTYKMTFPLRHPLFLIDNKGYASIFIKKKNKPFLKKIFNKIRHYFYTKCLI